MRNALYRGIDSRRTPFLALSCLLLLSAVSGCATTDPSAEERRPRRAEQPDFAPSLATSDSSVRTIQLYAGQEERRLPVLRLGSEGTLTLEFDLLGQKGRPLSVYFYHANRQWERDPMSARYLDGFRSGELLDFTRARAQGLPYVHYTYRFPARDVGFKESGNYILRVTEQGEEEEVLFERPFFVAEEAGDLEMRLEELRLGTQPGRSDRPTVRYRPPRRIGSSPFDFTTCFVPNGRLRQTRCVEDPSLSEQPVLRFELPYRESFAARGADFFLDLSRLQPGGEIATTDLQVVPHQVTLETDYAEFAGSARAPFLNGQLVVRRAGISASDPEVTAEYASVRFRFSPPDGRRLRGPLVVTGSFSDGSLEAAPRLQWQPAVGRYEGEVLLKQGLYEYRYASPDPRLNEVLARSLPLAQRHYAALIYYQDTSLGSDRLLFVREAQVP